MRDRIVYIDGNGQRGVDLRPFGIGCIPYLGKSRFLKARRGTVYHVHPGCVEICFCLKGRLLFESDNTCFQFLPGTVFVSNPDQPHRMRTCPKGLVVSSLLFRIPSPGKSILGLSTQESKALTNCLTNFPQRHFPATERAKKAFARVFDLYDSRDSRQTLARIEMRAAVTDLLLAIREAAHARPQTSHSVFTKISERMRRAPRHDYPIAALAKEAALSKFAFSEAFKRAIGLPPHAWLVECRVRAAKELLKSDKANIGEIATAVGFRSTPHFITTFRLSTGITPLQYRKHCNGKARPVTAPAFSPRREECHET